MYGSSSNPIAIPANAHQLAIELTNADGTPHATRLTSGISESGSPANDVSSFAVLSADEDARDGFLKVRISFNPPSSGEADLSAYNIYQTNSAGVKAAATPIAVISKENALVLPPVTEFAVGGSVQPATTPAFSVSIVTDGVSTDGAVWTGDRLVLSKKDGLANSVNQRVVLTGPGILSVEYLALEEGYDFLKIGGDKILTGSFDLSDGLVITGNIEKPMAMQIAPGQTSLQLYTDGTVVSDGFELHYVRHDGRNYTYAVDLEIASFVAGTSDFLAAVPSFYSSAGNVGTERDINPALVIGLTDFVDTGTTGGATTNNIFTPPTTSPNDAVFDDVDESPQSVGGEISIQGTPDPGTTFYKAYLETAKADGSFVYGVIGQCDASGTNADGGPGGADCAISVATTSLPLVWAGGSPPFPSYKIKIVAGNEHGENTRSCLKFPLVDIDSSSANNKPLLDPDVDPEAIELSYAITVQNNAAMTGLTHYEGSLAYNSTHDVEQVFPETTPFQTSSSTIGGSVATVARNPVVKIELPRYFRVFGSFIGVRAVRHSKHWIIQVHSAHVPA